MCPACGTDGQKISGRTVSAIVARDLRPLLPDFEGFLFCEVQTCPLLYFDNPRGVFVHLDEARKRVGHKETVPDRTICYCLLVPEEAILREVVDEGCCSTVADVRAYTRANTGKACEVTNPKGVCCDTDVEAVIQKGLHLARREALTEPVREAESCCSVSPEG